MERKTFAAEVVEKATGGGQIRISTAGIDRDRDRVICRGAQAENYLRNPVVQWGHGYYEPWQTIGRTTDLQIGESEIVASFELRPAANDQDPQNIVKLLWDGGWVNTASIGFNPLEWVDNEFGGKDITKWELLEWSLVPIPANQDALRLAAKALEGARGEGRGAIWALPDDLEMDEDGTVVPKMQLTGTITSASGTISAVSARMTNVTMSQPVKEEKAAPVDDEPEEAPDGDEEMTAGAMPGGDEDERKADGDAGNGETNEGGTEEAGADAPVDVTAEVAELRLAAILADFISSIRPYLATGE